MYRDTHGKDVIRIGDVMPSEEVNVKLKGRVRAVRITDAKPIAGDIKADSAAERPRAKGTSTPTPDDGGKSDGEWVDNKKLVALKGNPRRRRRTTEEYDELLLGGGADAYWEPLEPPRKRRAVPRPGYVDVEEMVRNELVAA